MGTNITTNNIVPVGLDEVGDCIETRSEIFKQQKHQRALHLHENL